MTTSGVTILSPDSSSTTELSPPAGWPWSCGLSGKSIKRLACWTARWASPGVAGEHGLPMRLADGSFYHGWARWCAGDGDGEAGMRQGLALWNEMYYRLFAPLTGTLLAEREAEAGRVEVALATLDAQLAAIEQTGQ